MRSSFASVTLPILSVNTDLSTVTIWDTLATESFGKLVMAEVNSTFPGASAQAKLLVSGTQTTVLMRLRFSESD